jgi:tetratricopeptide (TPR) repeat protein
MARDGMTLSAEFLDSVRAGLEFWRERLETVPESELEQERHNIYRLVEIGLGLPGMQALAAEVAAAAFPFVHAGGYWPEWMPVVERAASLYPQQPAVLRFWLLTRLGQLRRLTGKCEGALPAHAEALAIADSLGEPLLRAEGGYHLGRAYRDAHRYSEAKGVLKAARQVLGQMEGEAANRIAAMIDNASGRLAHDVGQLAEARTFMERAVAMTRTLTKTAALAEQLQDLGNIHRAAGEYEAAREAFEEALVLLPPGHPLARVMIQYDVGVLHFAQRDFAGAEAVFRAIDWPFLRETANLHLQARVLTALGNALLYQERGADAAETLEEAIPLWQQLEDDLELANAVGSRGEALAAIGKQEEAAGMFNKALAVLAHYPEHARAGRLRALFTKELDKLAAQAEA